MAKVSAKEILAIVDVINTVKNLASGQSADITPEIRQQALSAVVDGTPDDIVKIDQALQETGIANDLIGHLSGLVHAALAGVGSMIGGLFGNKPEVQVPPQN